MKRSLIAAAIALAPTAALATTVTIELPGSEPPSVQNLTYDCDGRTIGATYINTAANALAVLDLGEETVVMANVLAASGAKYAGQKYVWWTKGDEADLYDLTQDEKTPLAHCQRK
ncbi:MAG: MliC family protein [Rhizobiaceae bacterium]|nr:MliC family protein [Rhizobiaceae bacterium]